MRLSENGVFPSDLGPFNVFTDAHCWFAPFFFCCKAGRLNGKIASENIEYGKYRVRKGKYLGIED